MNLIYLIVAYLINISTCKDVDMSHNSLKYVFEIVRHGARAPLMDDPRFTTVKAGMLTPMGMR